MTTDTIENLQSFLPTVQHHNNYIERRQLTQSRRCAGLQRKTSSVPQGTDFLQNQLTLERFIYNFCCPYRSLRKKH